MKHEGSTEFAKQLIAADGGLRASEVVAQREKLLHRLSAAAQRERQGRCFAIVSSISTFVAFCALYTLAAQKLPANTWPQWAALALASGVILLPVFAILVLGVYLVNYRRELRKSEEELHRFALADLPRQISELREEIRRLRQVPKAPSEPPPSSKGAFTLLEMLMVIAIVSLLAGLALPALSTAKSRAHSLNCMSNLRQIGKALTMYEAEEGAYPGAGRSVRLTNQTIMDSGQSWNDRLAPFLGTDRNAISCWEHKTSGVGTVEPRSYGYNGFGSNQHGNPTMNLGLGLGRAYPAVKASDIIAPSDMIAIGDLQMPPGVWVNTINPTHQVLGGITGFIPNRHRGGANMLFCDNHVEFGKKRKWIEPTDTARRRWNKDNRPHREGW